jgi:YidC/Oxa1 family membrane protein insertase
MTQPTLFNQFLIWPILNGLLFFYNLFLNLGVPGSLGFAIVFLTILIRTLMAPLIGSQIKSGLEAQKLKPKLDELNKKFAKDKVRLQQEQMKLYREAGINPAAGCLPLILQMPVFIALYNVFWQVLGNSNLQQIVEEINKVAYFSFLKIQSLDLSFFGLNLADKPSGWNANNQSNWYLLLIPVLTAFLQWYSTKQMMPAIPTPVEKEEKSKDNAEDLAKTMQTQMSLLMPLMIGWFAFSFPVGLSFYWNTFTVIGIIQQARMTRKK